MKGQCGALWLEEPICRLQVGVDGGGCYTMLLGELCGGRTVIEEWVS